MQLQSKTSRHFIIDFNNKDNILSLELKQNIMCLLVDDIKLTSILNI